ncbi:PepSY domain-containing protein [Pseudomonadota bacterium]
MKTLLLFLVLAVGTISPSLADADRELDADTVRKWVEAGKVLPLEELLERHRQRIPGRLLDLEVEREHGRIVYELEVVDEQGQVQEIYLDAQTGEWLGQELED